MRFRLGFAAGLYVGIIGTMMFLAFLLGDEKIKGRVSMVVIGILLSLCFIIISCEVSDK